MAYVQLLDGVTAPNGQPAAVKATGSITTVAKADLIDGETFALNDGLGGCCIFVLDVDGSYTDSYTGAPRQRIDVSGTTTADDVRDALVTAINGCAYVRITASSGGTATVSLENDVPGDHGNTSIPDTVANATFAGTTFAGGEMDGVSTVPFRAGRSMDALGDADLVLVSTAGSGDLAVGARLWGFSPIVGKWVPVGIGADGVKGRINAGATMGESIADGVRHSEPVRVGSFDRVYLEIESLDGASTAVSAWLTSRRS